MTPATLCAIFISGFLPDVAHMLLGLLLFLKRKKVPSLHLLTNMLEKHWNEGEKSVFLKKSKILKKSIN